MNRPNYIFDKTLIFRQIPFFSGLNFFERRLVFDTLEIAEYRQGETIYSQGDPPDAFYFIITGRVQIFTPGDQKEEILEIIHRGKYFGFISLLTEESHSVSARAINDTVVAKIPRENFNTILKSIPRLAIDLSQMLSRRLKRKDSHSKTIFESTIIGVYGDERLGISVATYAVNLALGLKRETGKKAVLVDILRRDVSSAQVLDISDTNSFIERQVFVHAEEVSQKITHHSSGIDVLSVRTKSIDVALVPFLISLLTMLVNDYHYCFLPLLSDLGQEAYKLLAQTDLVHWLVSPNSTLLNEMTQGMLESGLWVDDSVKKKVKLIVLEEGVVHGKGPRLSRSEEASIFHQPIFATLPSLDKSNYLIDENYADPYSKTIRRITRQIGEALVGLALGSGAAMGLAHIGVLKVLEKENIPIDLVCGSSIGAFIGALWCSGYSAKEVEEIVLSNKDKPYLFGLDDLAFPLHGLIRGKHIRSFLNRYLKDKTFHNVKKAFKVVACDCMAMRQVVFDSGKLSDAVMASISIPGVFQPYKIANNYYIDGGILDPLPTDVLVESGAKKIISVNVLPSSEEIERTRELINKGLVFGTGQNAPFDKIFKYFRLKKKEFLKPNIFDVIVSSLQSMEYALAQLNSLSQSDVALHPDMTAIYWASFDHAPDLIKRGEEEALLHLSAIKELVTRFD
jgi:NTE family protein